MTTQYSSDWDELAQAQRARRRTQARVAAAPAAGAGAGPAAASAVRAAAASAVGPAAASAVRAAVGAAASEAADQGRWLTAILRPAGSMDRAALRGLCESLGHLASSSNMIIVDLTAAVVGKPGAFARDLLAPARRFEEAGQCLLLVGASPELTAALDRYAVPVVTLAADSLPPRAA